MSEYWFDQSAAGHAVLFYELLDGMEENDGKEAAG